MQTISATELARNTREILDRVVFGGETMAVERNQALIAKLLPVERTMTAAQALSGLAQPMLTVAQGSAWLADGRQDFAEGVRDPWA